MSTSSILSTMPEPDDIPPEELDMAVEESLGHPIPGSPQERMEALTRRIKYLDDQMEAAKMLREQDYAEQQRLQRELAAAKEQLQHWKTQHEGRN